LSSVWIEIAEQSHRSHAKIKLHVDVNIQGGPKK